MILSDQPAPPSPLRTQGQLWHQLQHVQVRREECARHLLMCPYGNTTVPHKTIEMIIAKTPPVGSRAL